MFCHSSDSKVLVTILDEDLRACEASVNGCHVQGALPFFTLRSVRNSLQEEKKKLENVTF